jgi:L-threonylcarbamoyladenylate synthase
MGVVEEAVSAIRAGQPAILPTDTVYGLCASPDQEDSVRHVYRLKGRPESQPAALLCSDLDVLFTCVPELRGRATAIARTLLPGPYTLVLPNPARRYRWLTGTRPDALGIRVPALGGDAADVMACVGAVVATSANLHGQPDPGRLDDVPAAVRAACAAVVDAGELPGTPSTVIDFTGFEPVVVRQGAAPVDEALERVAALV